MGAVGTCPAVHQRRDTERDGAALAQDPTPCVVVGLAHGTARSAGQRIDRPSSLPRDPPGWRCGPRPHHTRVRCRGVAFTSVSLWFIWYPPALTRVFTVRPDAGPFARTNVSLWFTAYPP